MVSYSNDLVKKLYRDLLTMRVFEEKLCEAYALGKVPGHIHSGLGEEGPYAGVFATRKEGDYYKISHRPVGAACVLGVSFKTAFSEIFGKVDGNSGGRGGVNHISQLSKGMLGFSGTLGCDIPVAVGAGITIQYKEKDNIVYVFFGDGTSSRGPVHEAMNFAAAWKLPVLFICENNQFAISTHVSEGVSIKNIADRAVGYGMPSKIVDGTNVLEIYDAAVELTDYIRKGNGPAFLECKSYRWRGHFEGDQARYRDKKITEDWVENKDCVKILEKYITENNVMTDEEMAEVKDKISAEIDDAIAFAEASPEPSPEDIYEYLYV